MNECKHYFKILRIRNHTCEFFEITNMIISLSKENSITEFECLMVIKKYLSCVPSRENIVLLIFCSK